MWINLLWAAVLICLSGCNLTPKYSRPEAPVPEVWPSGPAYQAQADPGAPVPLELAWREFFADAKLQAIIDTALKNNRDLRLAALNVERARALYRIQHAELYPVAQSGFTASKQRVQLSGTSGLTTVEQYTVNLGISSWEVDFFGRIRSLAQQALEEYFATAQARRSAQILLISEVANAYLTLAADQENLKLAQSTLEAQLAAYEVNRRRSEVGLAPELDVHRAQTQVDSARGELPNTPGLSLRTRMPLTCSPAHRCRPICCQAADRRRRVSGRLGRQVLGSPPEPPGYSAGRKLPESRQCPNRRGPGGIFPPHFPHNCCWNCQRRSDGSLSTWLFCLELRPPDHLADFRCPDLVRSESH